MEKRIEEGRGNDTMTTRRTGEREATSKASRRN